MIDDACLAWHVLASWSLLSMPPMQQGCTARNNNDPFKGYVVKVVLSILEAAACDFEKTAELCKAT